jgi:SAM-dependent methyltransferase
MRASWRFVALPCALVLVAGAALADLPSWKIVEDGTSLDVVYWPTPAPVVDAMLDLAQVKRTDLVYDLGCGDGRIVVTAAQRFGAHGIGFDLNPARVHESLQNVRRSHVAKLVQIRRADIFTVDLEKADVVFVYLLPGILTALEPQLAKLRPGSRIVSHEFAMAGAKPERVVRVIAPSDGSPHRDGVPLPDSHKVYLWRVPWDEQKPTSAAAAAAGQ